MFPINFQKVLHLQPNVGQHSFKNPWQKNHFIFTECNLHKISIFWLTVRCNVPRKHPSPVFPKACLDCDFLLRDSCHVGHRSLPLAWPTVDMCGSTVSRHFSVKRQPSSEGKAGGIQRLSLSVSRACRRVSHLACVFHLLYRTLFYIFSFQSFTTLLGSNGVKIFSKITFND